MAVIKKTNQKIPPVVLAKENDKEESCFIQLNYLQTGLPIICSV